MKIKMLKTLIMAGLLAWASGGLVIADCLRVTFNDGVADQPSTAGDVTRIQLDFDSTSGNYTVTWTASAANPFNGALRLNLNLGNAAVGPGLQASLFAVYTTPVAPTTQLSYSGNSPALTLWKAGDTVVSFAPSSFSSGIVDLDDISISNRDLVEESATVTSCDTDNDGVPDDLDQCPKSDLRATVWIGECDSGVLNQIGGSMVNRAGCSLADIVSEIVAEAAAGGGNHGVFVRRVAKALNALVASGIVTKSEQEALMNCVGPLKVK